MARPWRIQYADAIYHITARGNKRQDIFLDDRDRQYFLKLLERASGRFNLSIFAFCLMGNHFHLFLRTPEANLSEAMHWLNTSYTVYFNWRHKQIGHVLQGRFKSVLVLENEHWLHLSMYIHLNPLRAAMVDDPAQYPWSSYLDYVRVRARYKWLQRDEILEAYGAPGSRQFRYRKECLSLIGKKPEFVEQLRSGIILGPREKLAELAKKYRPSGQAKEITQFSLASRREIDPEHELHRVAKVFGIKVEELAERRRNFPARLAAYYHLVEHCGMSVTETARAMAVSRAAVCMGIRRLREALVNHKRLQKQIRALSVM